MSGVLDLNLRRLTWPDSAGRLTGALLILAGLLLGATGTRAQISPGPLSNAHHSLNGATQCTTCHQFGTAQPTFKCLDCHKEIAQLLALGQGYHAQLKMKNPTGTDCVKCHLEHNGANFELVHWDKPVQQFDHRQAGYALQGKHADLACEKCHTVAHMIPAAKALIQNTNLSKSYLGLSTNCVTCHEDVHKGDLGPDCQRCHNFTDWKQASQFDHSKTRFPLTGLHAQVACDKCHLPTGPDRTVKFTGLKFDACIDCHVDPHGGEFKATCETCHTTAGWKLINTAGQFDHKKTNFPLLGAHLQVECDSCHTGGDFRKPLSFDKCVDCHLPDPHKGQFAARASKGECAECHTVDAWKPSLFGVQEHNKTAYPLLGKHAVVACDKCHIPAGKDTLYKVKFAACMDCHVDAHDGQFAKAPYQNRCEICHSIGDFNRSKFTIAMHHETRFPLAGAHAVVPCTDCHKLGAAGRVDRILPFHFEDRTCTACHVDPHHGQFNDRMAQLSANGTPLGCEACHNVKSWVNALGFDHSNTAFPLTGAHRAVACSACHLTPPGGHAAKFQGTSKICEDCHTDVHGGQFAQENKTHCSECHNTERWAPSTFDHDKSTSFPLTGGHANVACAECHTQTRPIDGEAVLFYNLAPSKCVECHGDPKPTFRPSH